MAVSRASPWRASGKLFGTGSKRDLDGSFNRIRIARAGATPRKIVAAAVCFRSGLMLKWADYLRQTL